MERKRDLKRTTSKKFTKGPMKKEKFLSRNESFCQHGRLTFHGYIIGSVGHQRAADAIRIAANPQEAVIPRALRQLKKEVALKLEKLFDIAYFVAKIELPFTTYPHLCLLEEKHAVELGQTYRNDKACKDFIVAISDQFKVGLEANLIIFW